MTISTVALSTDRADRTGSIGGRTDGYYASEINALHLVVNRITALLSGIDSSIGIAEFVRDTVGATLVAGANVTVTVNDAANTITIAASGGGSTDPEFIRDTIGSTLIAGAGISVAVNDGSDTITITNTSTGGITSVAVNQTAPNTAPSGSVVGSVLTLNIPAASSTASEIFSYRKQLSNGAWPPRPAGVICISEYFGADQSADPSDDVPDDIFIAARVVVAVAPTITAPPTSAGIQSGQNRALTVAVSGTAPFTYQWYQGASGVTTTPVGTNSATYVTPALTSTTSYWCRVTNGVGSADSAAATLTIGTAPTITANPLGSAVTSGSSATLSVVAAGTAPLNYQWYQGASGNVSSPVVGAVSSSFVTPALTSTTTYWCRVQSAWGAVDSAAATVSVSTSLQLNLTDSGSTLSPTTGDGSTALLPYVQVASTVDVLLNVAASLGGSPVAISAMSVAVFKADGVTPLEAEPSRLFVVTSGSPWTLRVVTNVYGGSFLMRLTATVSGQPVVADRWISVSAQNPTYSATRLSNGAAVTQTGFTTTNAYIATDDTIVLAASHPRWGAATALAYVSDIIGTSPSGVYSQNAASLRINTRNVSTVNVQFRVAPTFSTSVGSIVVRDDWGNPTQPFTRRAVRFEPAPTGAALAASVIGGGVTGDGLTFATLFNGSTSGVALNITAVAGGTVSGITVTGYRDVVSNLPSGTVSGDVVGTAGTEVYLNSGQSGADFTAAVVINALINGVAATPITRYWRMVADNS